MKVLLLSCNTGGGHNSAAQAVQDVLIQRGAQTELIDPIQFKSEKVKNIVSDAYNNIIKNVPNLFGVIYNIGAAYEATHLPSPVYYANSAYAQELKDYILQNEFDCVICSHLYGMEAMTYAREKLGLDIPCYSILTDYTFIPFFSDTKLDGYFIPHEELKKEGVKKGIPAEKMYPYGIPVNPKFSQRIEKMQARKTLGLPLDKKIILLLFGSVGSGKIYKLCNELAKELDEGYVTYVITGNNEELKQKIDKKHAATGKIVTLPYTKEVNLYMNAADVLISKAGGLSSTEAAVANVPLVHLKSIPGCETKNARFFSKHGMCLATKKITEAVQFAKALATDEEKAENMRAAQRETIPLNAAERIIDTITKKIMRD